MIYTRVSSAEQLDNTSLQTQIEKCREYAEKNGLEVVAEFGGTYESAKSDKDRKEFKRMLDFLKGRTKISQVVVYSLDRFSRTGGGAISIIEKLKEKGIDVHAVTQPTDTDTAIGKLMQQVNLIFSNFDNNLRSDKTAGGMLKRMQNGYYCGCAPVGYKNVKIEGVKTIIPDPKTAKFIKLAFKWKAEEGVTNEEVRARLKARGYNIPKQTLCRTLKNPLYCGLLSHNLLDGELLPGKHKPLITKEIFLAANEVNERFSKPKSYDPEKTEVALKRFLRCEKCGEALRGYVVKKKGIWYYKCCTKGCKVNRNAGKVHDLFLSELENFTLPEHFIAPVRDQFKALVSGYFERQTDELNQLRAQLSAVETKIDKLETKFLFDEIPASLYEKHKGKIEAEKSKIEAEIERTGKQVSNLDDFVDDAVEIARNLAVLWENGNYDERQRLQNLVFPEGMYYCKENDKCRTPRVNSIFGLYRSVSTIVSKKRVGQTDSNCDLSHLVPQTGIEPAMISLKARWLSHLPTGVKNRFDVTVEN